MTTERELPDIQRAAVLPRVNIAPSLDLLNAQAAPPDSEQDAHTAPESRATQTAASPKPEHGRTPATKAEPGGRSRAVADAEGETAAGSEVVVARHRRQRKLLVAEAGHAPRPRRRPLLLGAAGVAMLVAVPFVVISALSPGHDPTSSAANTLPDSRKPAAPVPTWAAPTPSAPSGSPSPSAADRRVPGPKHTNESVIDGRPRPVAGGAHGSAKQQKPTVHTNTVAGASHLIIGYQSNLCIAVVGGKPVSKAHLVTWDCNGNAYEKWTFQSDGTIRAMGMCMDVAWGAVDDGTTIQLEQCDGLSAQRFVLYSNGDLVSTESGKCVDVKNAQTTRGTGLQLWGCGGNPNQKWRVA